MTFNAKFIITCGAVLSALSGMSWAAWSFGDATGYRPALIKELRMVMDQTEQNTLAAERLEFNNLDGQYKNGALDNDQKQKRCQLAYDLRYFSVEGCLFPVNAPPQPS